MKGDFDPEVGSRSGIWAAAGRFRPQDRIADIREYGNGNVNDTFLVTLDSPKEPRFILQRLNTRVFPRPEGILRNMGTIGRHLDRRPEPGRLGGGRRWELPRLLSTQDGRDHFVDPAGSFWRAMGFIENAQSFEVIRDQGQATEVGYALGRFHTLISDLPADQLVDTLEGFHITPRYLRHFDRVLAQTRRDRSPEKDYALRSVSERRSWAGVLEEAQARDRLCLRPIHGDPKVNNILMDTHTRQAVGLVDLDTVKPGLVHYDIGDLLRSGCNPLGEEAEEWEGVRFEVDLCRAVLQGYLSQAGEFLLESDYAYLFDSIRLIPFELGLRFLTDYWEGNVYFKVRHPEHNLVRALVQFKLTESVEAQEAAIRAIIRDLR